LGSHPPVTATAQHEVSFDPNRPTESGESIATPPEVVTASGGVPTGVDPEAASWTTNSTRGCALVLLGLACFLTFANSIVAGPVFLVGVALCIAGFILLKPWSDAQRAARDTRAAAKTAREPAAQSNSRTKPLIVPSFPSNDEGRQKAETEAAVVPSVESDRAKPTGVQVAVSAIAGRLAEIASAKRTSHEKAAKPEAAAPPQPQRPVFESPLPSPQGSPVTPANSGAGGRQPANGASAWWRLRSRRSQWIIGIVVVLSIAALASRGTSAPENRTEAGYRDCMLGQMESDQPVEDALRACDSQRPDSVTKMAGCGTYVILSEASGRYETSAADPIAEANSCAGY